MHKVAVEARKSGVFKHYVVVKSGIFATSAVARYRLSAGQINSKSSRECRSNKKIVTSQVFDLHSLRKQIHVGMDGLSVIFGALPIFVPSQKLGAM